MSSVHSQSFSDALIVISANIECLTANKASILSELCKDNIATVYVSNDSRLHVVEPPRRRLESTHPSRTSVKSDQGFWCRVSHACQRWLITHYSPELLLRRHQELLMIWQRTWSWQTTTCLQETHRAKDRAMPSIPDVVLVAEHPHNKHGSSVFVRDGLKVNNIYVCEEDNVEFITVELAGVVVHSMYKPPDEQFLLQTTKHTSGGAVTAVTNCCANCVVPSRPQQWGPDLPFFGGKPGEALSSLHNHKHTNARRVQNTTVYSDGTTHSQHHRSKGVQPNGSPCANNHCCTRYEQRFRHNKHTYTN